MSFSDKAYDNKINIVINGCKDCPLRGYDVKKSNNMRCYFMNADIDLDKLKGYERPNWCLLPTTIELIVRPHGYAETKSIE